MAQRDVVVLGASAGGVEAFRYLLSRLSADLPAGLLLVQHTSPRAQSDLAEVLGQGCPLPVKDARDGERFALGRVYVAPPDRHLRLVRGKLRVVDEPPENRMRPALDPLFRSAAEAYGARVVGVVLTGLGNDGSAGLAALKRGGGTAVVQHPEDAAHPEMPQGALEALREVGGVDHCATLEELPDLLNRLVREEVTGGSGPTDAG